MPTYSNLSCITDLIGVKNTCETQTSIRYFLDALGISLKTASETADERYVNGQTMVDEKIRIALDDVYMYLTKNVSDDCDLDKADGIICDNAQRIARVVWYRTAALIFKEISIDSSRYNDYIHYAGDDALAQMVYYDSDLKGFTTLENVQSGMYQKELLRLEYIITSIQQNCCVQNVGSRWSITSP